MDEFADIIVQLEQKRAAIDKAIEALGATQGTPTVELRRRGRPPGTKNTPALVVKKSGGLSEAGRQSLSENMRKRWALKRAAAKKAMRKATKKTTVS